ncbi:hypothetical protein [Polaribacter sargassicola]|uniref:hypothetical protein n=1 Tax=Polaribacter sargassicola TaxID=2836891 RepID=UPI001F4825FF|nr:hypothetical protein [Polaribacter sp. DS7-9]MCG1036990.1 hypothetical protein [Polaribacter sp. DS7-9]
MNSFSDKKVLKLSFNSFSKISTSFLIGSIKTFTFFKTPTLTLLSFIVAVDLIITSISESSLALELDNSSILLLYSFIPLIIKDFLSSSFAFIFFITFSYS